MSKLKEYNGTVKRCPLCSGSSVVYSEAAVLETCPICDGHRVIVEKQDVVPYIHPDPSYDLSGHEHGNSGVEKTYP
jgi:hypothetical protein